MTTKIKNWLTVTVMAVTISNASCTLDEYNPSGYTMDALFRFGRRLSNHT